MKKILKKTILMVIVLTLTVPSTASALQDNDFNYFDKNETMIEKDEPPTEESILLSLIEKEELMKIAEESERQYSNNELLQTEETLKQNLDEKDTLTKEALEIIKR